MDREIDLMRSYPRSKRNVEQRGQEKTDKDREIARQFGQAFFDGERSHGYGGFHYNPKYWQPVIPTFQEHFNIQAGSQILDVGCAKGFMLHDMQVMIPGIEIQGIDVSNYAIENAMDSVKPSLSVGCATKLPFPDNSFDLIISITTLHNLEIEDLATALREITRVSRGSSFITVDAYRDDDEKRRMEAWNLTAKTMMSVDEWKAFFAEIGYDGYYYWFIP